MIQNRMEEHVREAYQRLLPDVADFCGCEVCQADVLVYALNRLPARYAVSHEGRVLTEVTLEQQQTRANIEVIVLEGLAKVVSAPRCGQVKSRLPRR